MIENRLSSGACTLFDNCTLRQGWSGMSEPTSYGTGIEAENIFWWRVATAR